MRCKERRGTKTCKSGEDFEEWVNWETHRGAAEGQEGRSGPWDQQLLHSLACSPREKDLPLYDRKCRKENFLEIRVTNQMGSAWNKTRMLSLYHQFFELNCY